MSPESIGLDALKALHGDCQLLREGGVPVVLLRQCAFRAVDGADMRMDLLLHPSAHSGYTTRLFFERAIRERAGNWNQHRVVDREWWAPSWQNVQANLSWPSMLCAHLRAVA